MSLFCSSLFAAAKLLSLFVLTKIIVIVKWKLHCFKQLENRHKISDSDEITTPSPSLSEKWKLFICECDCVWVKMSAPPKRELRSTKTSNLQFFSPPGTSTKEKLPEATNLAQNGTNFAKPAVANGVTPSSRTKALVRQISSLPYTGTDYRNRYHFLKFCQEHKNFSARVWFFTVSFIWVT